MLINGYNVLNAFTGAADAVLDDHILTITGAPPMDYRKIEVGRAIAAVAGTAAVWDITPVAANSTRYEILIKQPVNGEMLSYYISHTTPAAGGTATTISDAFKAAIALTNLRVTTDAVGAASVTITADSGYEIFFVTDTGDGDSGVVETTPGVAQVGTAAALEAQGVTGVTAGASYTTYLFIFAASSPSEAGGNIETSRTQWRVYGNVAGANYAAFNTAITDWIAGGAGGVTDPDTVSLD